MSHKIVFRAATYADVPSIIRLLADDELGSQREKFENPIPESYYSAYELIDKDPNHELIVADLDGDVIGTLHLIFLPSLSFQGGLRAQLESVRVDTHHQNQGVGSQMMKWAIRRAKDRNAHIVQLTTHKSRADAHRFYERLGFKGTHLGMKLSLT
ncbi:MAG: GNAT family N-acetyltransferase [Chloroflexota bacterium]|nr:GNAT family N-acetyltransferase [Chloroflexota bacterium]